jgi:transcriptional regulator with XRE-family HTH domain
MHRVTQKIDKLRLGRGWTVYRLAQESGLSAAAIHKWLRTDAVPSLPALEEVCAAFGITAADFFAEGDLIEATPRLKALYAKWCALPPKDQASIESILNSLSEK